MKLHRDDVDGPGVEATRASLEDALAALDGDACTLVSLEGIEAVLMCGGDVRSGLVVTLQSPMRTAVLTADGDATGRQVTLVAGGQPGDYPAEQVVDRTTATQAMVAFLETEDLDDGLTWSSD